jgi:hypothetical protein
MSSKFTDEQVAIIKGQSARGDKQMQIALWHNVNQARICEVLKDHKKKWRHVQPAIAEILPPAPPYVVVPQYVADRGLAYTELAAELSALATKYTALAAKL